MVIPEEVRQLDEMIFEGCFQLNYSFSVFSPPFHWGRGGREQHGRAQSAISMKPPQCIRESTDSSEHILLSPFSSMTKSSLPFITASSVLQSIKRTILILVRLPLTADFLPQLSCSWNDLTLFDISFIHLDLFLFIEALQIFRISSAKISPAMCN